MGAEQPAANAGGQEQASASFAAWLRSWRYFILLLCLALVVALFYGEENWRGNRAWNKYKQHLAANGIPTAPAAIIPKPVPLSENFAATPFLAPLFDFIPGTQRWRTTNGIGRAQGFGSSYDAVSRNLKPTKVDPTNSWINARLDLRAWNLAFQLGTNAPKSINSESAMVPAAHLKEAAEGVLNGLSECDPVIEELRAASRRRYSRFDLKYDDEDPAAILLPHLAVLKHVSQILQLRACAELALGHTDDAASDAELLLYVANATREEPVMVSHLVRMTQLRLVIQVIAEGMGQWSDPQLRSFQESLLHFDFCADMQRSLDAERVFFGGGMIDYVRRNPEMFSALSGSGTGKNLDLPGVLLTIAPSGWFGFEKVNYNRAFDVYRMPGLDLQADHISPKATTEAANRMTQLAARPWPVLFLRHRVFCAMLLPGFAGILTKAAFSQTAANVAAIACALERYRLANNSFPESLNSLVHSQVSGSGTAGNQSAPGFFMDHLPEDVINRQPLIYRRTEDGRYVLYSVGWNEKDDGGTNVVTKGEGDIPLQGDWVWRPL